ncbi:MAG: adenylyl-sulfate kinase [Bacteroidetes bacterium]|nr:adenylyl-sulfate kinase [Bacteroidota bacterium]
MENPQNIHPIFDQILQRADKEKLTAQKGKVIWMTGLSGSGKSTLAKGLEHELHEMGRLTQILDGDNVRTGINNNLGFTDEDRKENIRRIAEVSKLFIDCGVITINSFVSPTIEIRQQASDIIGREDFIEVYINASLEACEARDVKGLYAKARSGEIENFTGIDSPFEPPENPDLELTTDNQTEEESLKILLEYIVKQIQPNG